MSGPKSPAVDVACMRFGQLSVAYLQYLHCIAGRVFNVVENLRNIGRL